MGVSWKSKLAQNPSLSSEASHKDNSTSRLTMVEHKGANNRVRLELYASKV